MENNDIQTKREKFRAYMRKFLRKVSVIEFESVDKALGDEENVIIVSRVQDFDMRDNDLWELDENKSYPRKDVICDVCTFPCVMSNYMYSAYTKHEGMPKVMCTRCFAELDKK